MMIISMRKTHPSSSNTSLWFMSTLITGKILVLLKWVGTLNHSIEALVLFNTRLTGVWYHFLLNFQTPCQAVPNFSDFLTTVQHLMTLLSDLLWLILIVPDFWTPVELLPQLRGKNTASSIFSSGIPTLLSPWLPQEEWTQSGLFIQFCQPGSIQAA